MAFIAKFIELVSTKKQLKQIQDKINDGVTARAVFRNTVFFSIWLLPIACIATAIVFGVQVAQNAKHCNAEDNTDKKTKCVQSIVGLSVPLVLLAVFILVVWIKAKLVFGLYTNPNQ